MVLDTLPISLAGNSCDREARPMNEIYNVVGMSTPKTISRDHEKLTRYNRLNRKMIDVCWECSHGPMKPSGRCKRCVKKYLNEDLPTNFKPNQGDVCL